jgi:hypothetical protein
MTAINPDIARKAAYDEWRSRLMALERAAYDFYRISNDPRLVDRINETLPIPPSTPAISFDSLCVEIQKPHKHLTALNSRLKGANAAIAKIQNGSFLVTPIHRLPPEVLQSIFLFASYDTYMLKKQRDYTWTQISMSQRRALCLVCHAWHNICANTPQFWTSLDFYHDAPKFNRTRLHLQRTRGARLSLSIDLHRSRKLNESLETLVALVASHQYLSQIDRLAIIGSKESLLKAMSLFKPLALERCSLRELSLLGPERYHEEIDPAFQQAADEFIQRFTSFSEVVLTGIPFQWSNPRLCDLVVLRLDSIPSPSVPELHIILHACPMLREFQLNNPSSGANVVHHFFPLDQKFVLPDLRLLVLVSAIPMAISSYIFSMMEAPSLRSLCIDNYVLQDNLGLLLGFFKTSFIEYFELFDWDAENDDGLALRSALKALTHVRTLQFTDGDADEEVLHILTPVNDGAIIVLADNAGTMGSETVHICPELEELSFLRMDIYDLTMLDDIVRGRANSHRVTTLRRLLVHDCIANKATGFMKIQKNMNKEREKLSNSVAELDWNFNWEPYHTEAEEARSDGLPLDPPEVMSFIQCAHGITLTISLRFSHIVMPVRLQSRLSVKNGGLAEFRN